MVPIITVLIMSALSALLLAGGCFLPRKLGKACAVLTAVWLAAAMPIMFLSEIDMRHMLLFYLLSAACGLIILFGGKKA